jgi:nicotinamidase/pyrazinamidase
MASQSGLFDRDRTVLLLVDIQPDFMPGGQLPVPDGDGILQPLQALIEAGEFRHLVATQDWHPPHHISFASSHIGCKPMDTIELYGHGQTLWPDHCVQGTPGADLHPGLSWDRVSIILRKGTAPDSDSYSGFRNNWDKSGMRRPTGLAGYLRDLGTDTVFVCGLARDVCVACTAEDAADAGFKVRLLWDLTRPVDPGSEERTRSSLEKKGIEIIVRAPFLPGRTLCRPAG